MHRPLSYYLIGHMLTKHDAEFRKHFAMKKTDSYRDIYRCFYNALHEGRTKTQFVETMSSARCELSVLYAGKPARSYVHARARDIVRYIGDRSTAEVLAEISKFYLVAAPKPATPAVVEPNPEVEEFMARQVAAPTAAMYCVFWDVPADLISHVVNVGVAAGLGPARVAKR